MAFLAGAAGGASVSIVVNAVDKFSKVFDSAQTQMKGLVGYVDRHQAAFRGAGTAITGVGVASGLAMGGLVKKAIDFEDAFIGVRKTVDLSEKEFGDLENRFKEMTKTIPLSFEELAGIGEIAGQLGVQGVDNIAQFTKTVADISATTNLTAEQAATDFARFANVMGMPISEVDKLGSVVVDLGNNLATTESEIVSMGMRISGAGKTLNMTEGEVMAWSGALSSVGIEAEMGGSAMSKLMINISGMVSSGSEELEGFASVAGMTADEFSKAFKEDASNALLIFFEGLGKVKSGGGDVLAVLEELDIKEIRLRDAVLRLSSSHETLSNSLNIQKTAWNENTALSEEAQKRYESMKSQLTILGNQFKILAADLGDVLFPMIEKIIGAVTKLTDWFSNLSDGQKKFLVVAGGVATVLGLFVGPLFLMVSFLPGVVAGFALLISPLGLVFLGIGLLIAIGWLLIKHWDNIKVGATKLGVGVKNVFIGIHNVVLSVWNGIISIMEGSINRIVGMINSLIRIMNKIPGVDIGTLGDVSFGKYKAEMMSYEKYVPTPTLGADKGGITNIYHIDNINGLSGRDIAESLQEELNKKI